MKLPKELQDAIDRLGGTVINLNDDSQPTFKQPAPATKEEARSFLGGIEEFRVGDVVKWRPGHKSSRAPSYDDELVVTQVLETPVRLMESNLSAAERLDIGLAFMHPVRPDTDGGDEAILADALFDSRRFYKVGSIHND